eukprot:GFKZ01012713.1.p1 GENE.GFKZ01012713.1~~GFKZ01012713.1.p1  ORF type:complete len:326 (-),score=33.58 GFKZ01012713.1:481-1458(-)
MWTFEPRAVVAPAELYESRDVTVPTPTHVKSSPYPFGLGVYNSPRYGKKKGLPLVYVPPRAAAHRSDFHTVKPGWYVIARPGTTIELRTTLINDQARIKGDQLTTCIYVDGECSNEPHSFRNSSSSEFVTSGIAEFTEMPRGGATQRRVRKFKFEGMSSDGNSGKGGNSIQVIQLRVCVPGEDTWGSFSSSGNRYQETGRATDAEKFTSREFESRQSGPRRQSFWERRLSSSRSFATMTDIPEATVTIMMREISWMRSRKLIDDEGRPCTHDMFLRLVQKDGNQAVPSPFGARVVLDEGSVRKKPKLIVDPPRGNLQSDGNLSKQ